MENRYSSENIIQQMQKFIDQHEVQPITYITTASEVKLKLKKAAEAESMST